MAVRTGNAENQDCLTITIKQAEVLETRERFKVTELKNQRSLPVQQETLSKENMKMCISIVRSFG